MLKRSLFCLFGLLMSSGIVANVEPVEKALASKVLVLGDSLSAAYGLPPEQGWVAALSRHFAASQIRFINASVSGATTASGLQRLPALLRQHQPDWVVIELGANDGLQGKPIPYIKRNIDALIKQAKAADSRVVLLGVRLPPNLGRRYTDPFFGIYETLADKHQLHYVPFILEGVAGNGDLMQDDGLHPNVQGQKVMAKMLTDQFSAFFGAQHAR